MDRIIFHSLSAIVLSAAFLGTAAQAEDPVDFRKEIFPIFEASCFACHGEAQQMGELRLDAKTNALKGGVSGPSIVPGRAEKSSLVRRIAHAEGVNPMPMGGKKLSESQIGSIRAWINQGAEWPDTVGLEQAEVARHWAFVSPQRPVLPKVRDQDWARNPIDRFVLARLEKDGLSPAPEADRLKLLRRAALDLVGLPPTIEEADAFAADRDKKAYEKQVNRLLDSPHYGERWGRHWLDAARYADSDGFEKDKPRFVWFYRDWVVNALNRDLPYDQFIIEQIAGDLLPNPTQDQRVATGFLRNSMINEEGGTDPEQFRMEAMFDRMDAVGKSILGVTVQCTQCHDHKYDPLTQEEYYRLFAFLNNSHEGALTVYTEGEREQRRAMFGEMAAVEDRLKTQAPDWRERMEAWVETVKDDQPEWIVVQPRRDETEASGARYTALEDGSYLAQGYAPPTSNPRFILETELRNITAVRFELMTHPDLPRKGPGRSIKGTGALTELKLEAAPADDPENVTQLKFSRATADVNPPEHSLDKMFQKLEDDCRTTGPASFAIDGDEETAWGFDIGPGRRNQSRKAVFTLAEPFVNSGKSVLNFYVVQKHGGWNGDDNQNHNLGRFRISLTTDPTAQADPLPTRVRELVGKPASDRTAADNAEIFHYWRTTLAEWKDANERIDGLWALHPEGTTQLVLNERPEKRVTKILERGDYLRPTSEVTPGVPATLHALPETNEPGRLRVAKWLASRESPTTARAMVNRIWQGYFGRGVVASPENLGTQAEPPSHPKLLDWLAVEFMENDWSLKHIHRLIVNSATYRQSSRMTEDQYRQDPYNTLLARGPRFRVEGEVVRDIALAASGLLSKKMGGPGVYPPAPEFIFLPPVSYGPKVWNTEKGEDRYRRSIYTFRFRSVPYPVLQTFDTPDGNAAVIRRDHSNTPLQALTVLNEDLFMESARALALKTLNEAGGDDEARVTYAFRRCLTRPPSEPESRELLRLLRAQLARFTSGELDPWELAANDPKQPPELADGTTPEQLAAWTAVSRVLLNLDETITKE